jgi:hypothetical protein
MVPSRLDKKMLLKLEGSLVWVRSKAVRINLAVQSLKNKLLIFDNGLSEAGCK